MRSCPRNYATAGGLAGGQACGRRVGDARRRADLGDVFAHALVKATGKPLLFKGDDFSHTDVVAA